ncbi:MAG: RNA ligase family protein [bacterium]
MKKFTDIGQFRNVVKGVKSHHDYQGKDENGKSIYLHKSKYPTLSFRGTVKTHGTNGAICKYADGSYVFQSRENELSFMHDNSYFMNEMQTKNYKKLFDGIEFDEYCCIYGEWVGKGIQKNVAVSELPHTFIIFAMRIDGEYVDIAEYPQLRLPEDKIYNTLDFPHWDIEIDFNEPEVALEKIVDMVQEVENQCPVGKYFGVEGIGEGIVFEYNKDNVRYIFKAKGEKHAGKSKVKKIKKGQDPETIRKLKEVANKVTPVWRLNQMLTETCDLNNGGYIDRTKLGDYLRNLVQDVIKEDLDIITDAGYTVKDVAKYISEIGRLYFFEQEANDL